MDNRQKLNEYELSIIRNLLSRAAYAALAAIPTGGAGGGPAWDRYIDLSKLEKRLAIGGRRRVTRPVDLGNLTIPAENRLI